LLSEADALLWEPPSSEYKPFDPWLSLFVVRSWANELPEAELVVDDESNSESGPLAWLSLDDSCVAGLAAAPDALIAESTCERTLLVAESTGCAEPPEPLPELAVDWNVLGSMLLALRT